MANKLITIYKITHVESNKIYIGLTSQKVESRWRFHCKNKYKRSYLQNSIAKYGKDAFDFEVIAYCFDRDFANQVEIDSIKYHDCLAPKGFNCTEGGDGTNPTAEVRMKMSLAKKGKPSWNTGIKAPSIAKVKMKQIYCANNDKVYPSMDIAAKELNLLPSKISQVCRGGRNCTGKYFFAFNNEKLNKQDLIHKMKTYKRGRRPSLKVQSA